MSTSNGTVTVSITSVDTTKSFLIFQTRHNSNRPPGSEIRGRIATPTSLEFVRVTDGVTPEPVTITIHWYVVSFSSGVKVQRGAIASQNATTLNVTLPTPVAAVNQAFVTWSKTPAASDVIYDNNDPILGELTSTTNLQFRVNAANASHIIWWQVIEFTNPADITVQKGSVTTMTGTTTSVTATLSPPVDVTRTFVLVGYRTAGTGADVGSRMLRAQLTDSTTITIDRSISGSPDDITEIVWQAVELKDGSRVRQGSENFPTGVAQRIVPITSIDLNRSVAFASVQPVGGQNMGRSPYAGDDIIGVGSVTMALSPAQITMDRNNTAATADVGWFVVEFNGPSVAVSNSTFAFGTRPADTWLPPDSALITNDSPVSENIVGKISTFTSGANTWSLSASANGPDQIRAQWSTASASGPWSDISAYNMDFTIMTGLAPLSSVSFYFRIQTPTSTSSFNQYSSTFTVTAQ